MLNRGYAYTTIISSKTHGQTLLSHLASLYPHSTEQAWQQKLNNGEVSIDGVTATGSESVAPGQTLVWNRPPWIEPDSPQHFEVLFEDPYLLAVNKPSGLPTLPGGGFMENTLLRLVQKQSPNANPVHRLGRATSGIVLFTREPDLASQGGFHMHIVVEFCVGRHSAPPAPRFDSRSEPTHAMGIRTAKLPQD